MSKVLADVYACPWCRSSGRATPSPCPVILVTTPLAAWPTLLQVASPRLQAVRGLMPVLASFAVVAGLALLPLAEVTALTFASPLLVVALSAPLLGERTTSTTG